MHYQIRDFFKVTLVYKEICRLLKLFVRSNPILYTKNALKVKV